MGKKEFVIVFLKNKLQINLIYNCHENKHNRIILAYLEQRNKIYENKLHGTRILR